MNKKPTKINLTSDDSLFEKSLNLQKYIEELKSQSINLDDKFSFTWAGKGDAIKSVLIPSKLTLNPKPEESIKWDESDNLFIEGDNLEVLKLLQKAYFEKVKMIYIDPPYNTGHDFVYNDDFSSPLDNYLKQTGQKTESGESATTNKETNGRYHSDWLSMMYPRLKLAWNLLREDGVIFVSIDDNEVHHLRMLMDEIFGEDNFIGDIVWNSTKSVTNTALISVSHTHNLCYAKDKNYFTVNRVHFRLPEPGEGFSNPDNDPRGPWKADPFQVGGERPNQLYEVINPKTGKVYKPNSGSSWKNELKVFNQLMADNRIVFGISGEAGPQRKRFQSEAEERGRVVKTIWDDVDTTTNATKDLKEMFDGLSVFDNPKPVDLIKRFIQLGVHDAMNSIVLDFFAGSGTTAHSVISLNQEDGGKRKFIIVQLPEKIDTSSEAFKAGYKLISNITKERIRRAIRGYGKNPQPINSGFKAFTLTKSNYPENNYVFNPEKSSEENQQAFITYLDKAKQSQLFDEENDISIIYENVVKEGLSLNSKVEKISIGKNNVYQVTDGERQLLICLENKLAPEIIKELTNNSHKDKLFICLERALDDTMAANLALNLDLKTI